MIRQLAVCRREDIDNNRIKQNKRNIANDKRNSSVVTHHPIPLYHGLLGPTIQSSIANHSLHDASATRNSSSVGSRSGRRNGACSSGRISYALFVAAQPPLFAAKR